MKTCERTASNHHPCQLTEPRCLGGEKTEYGEVNRDGVQRKLNFSLIRGEHALDDSRQFGDSFVSGRIYSLLIDLDVERIPA